MSFTGVYAILDLDAWRARGVDPAREGAIEAIAGALLGGGASVLQLRAKNEGGRATLSLLRRLRAVVTGVPLFANDRADLALLAGCDGVHVGQDDLPVDDVRRIAPGLLVGVSTHDPAQLDRALSTRPSYLAFGPVFATKSKANPDPVVGVDGLRRAVERAGTIPLVAIGGIDRSTVPEVARAGARAIAVISELVATRDGAPDLAEIAARTRALSEALS